MPKLLRKNILATTLIFALGVFAACAVFVILGWGRDGSNNSGISGFCAVFAVLSMGHSQWYDKFMKVAPYTISQKRRMFERGLFELVIYKTIISVLFVSLIGLYYNYINWNMVIAYMISFSALNTMAIFFGYYSDTKQEKIQFFSMFAYIILGAFSNACIELEMQPEDYVMWAISTIALFGIFVTLYRREREKILTYYCEGNTLEKEAA